MVGVGRDLCGSSGPTPLPKQGHPDQASQDLIQVGFEYLQRRLHGPSGQPVFKIFKIEAILPTLKKKKTPKKPPTTKKNPIPTKKKVKKTPTKQQKAPNNFGIWT